VIQVKVQFGAMASDRRRPKASLFEPTAEVTEKSSILLAELLTPDVVIRIFVEHQISLIGAGHLDADPIGLVISPMLPAVHRQHGWALQQPASMARWWPCKEA
jgi:hypothetical protein